MAQKIFCDRKWRFVPKFEASMIFDPIEDAEIVNLPHTLKETPFDYFDESSYQMVACYQKSMIAPVQWKDKIVEITFEGVGHACEVYVNGKLAGSHNCGYTAFTLDISKLLIIGDKNLITVKVDSRESLNQPPFGYVIDYMTYGGIYRDVYFTVKSTTCIKDAFFMPTLLEKVSTRKKTVNQIKLMKGQGILRTDFIFPKEIFDLAFDEHVFIKQYINGELVLSQPVGGFKEIEEGYLFILKTAPMSVKLWDVESPTLYNVVTELLVDDEVVDEHQGYVGFRSSEFRKDGYYLNGRKLKLRGLNRHQSYPYVGYAMPESMQRLDAKILKEELACNAVRTSHYPQSHYFIDECDKIGLLVFTELPGWQHIGDKAWQDIAVKNTSDMVKQYRNHPSIILWGVRINESADNDEFYLRTNEAAHEADPTRPTGGVRAHAKSSLLEDVYTYNDFVHSGANEGCQPKDKVTSNNDKPYLISEFNGHMYPTKTFDDEEQRRNHALRHANVLNDVAKQKDIAGCFGWCMFDYNTHKDFGSGDRICYHGVMDMFRNPKLAAYVYSSYGTNEPVLEISSSFDIGEHPACNRGNTYIFSNADSVRMYKNDEFIKEYFPKDSSYSAMPRGPILIDDFVGDALIKDGSFKKGQAKVIKDLLNYVALKGYEMSPKLIFGALKLILIYHMSPNEAVPIYNKFVGDWGGQSSEYKFEAIMQDQVAKTVIKSAAKEIKIKADASHTLLTELHTYDVAEIRLKAVDQNDNVLSFFGEPVSFEVDGPIEIIGPETVPFRGGFSGVYIKSIGEDGDGKLTIKCRDLEPVTISVSVECLSK